MGEPAGASPLPAALVGRPKQGYQRPYLTAFQGLWTYLEWATESARMLRSQISDRDLDVLNVRIVEIAGLIARLQGPRELTE
ncbi:hypothetical protein [Streptomyces sp. MB09-02B]|uniref:hypothetical protein n=1 Tax=Streptomyces sp. MB09-02B TaxID=3028667 RepID=UPI0029B06DDD|nr:hypothetical protein [Streptomyces sp. MB09-02B]MDX3638613.1 hypothetical protein [Streptomyces sp. MB09-02B]